MAVLATAVCPHPPLLVPSIAAGAALELDSVRAGCRQVVARLMGLTPDVLVVVGDAPAPLDLDETAGGSFAGFGLDVRVGNPDPAHGPSLPLALAVGAWLLDDAGWTGRRRYLGLPDSTTGADAGSLGADLAATDGRDGSIAVLIMGDGSARRSTTAPGYLDPRAAAFDATVASALASMDASALLNLDAALAIELLAAGRASWQLLGGLVGADSVATGRSWTGDLVLDTAPYGVGYLVATAFPEPAGG